MPGHLFIVVLALTLTACGHREKKAPCSPSDGTVSGQPLAFAPLATNLSTECGPLKAVNGDDLLPWPPVRRGLP